MKDTVRNAALAVAAAALVVGAATGPAEASLWPFFTGTPDQGALPAASAPNAADRRKPQVMPVGQGGRFHDGSFTGQTFDAYWGQVQVKAHISGGQIVSVDVLQYPRDRSTSRYINSQALPMLESEVISAQSMEVDIVSGATLTSEAFIRSLRTALGRAGGGA